MGISERLREIATELGSAQALAKAARVSKGRVSQWLNGQVTGLSAESALTIEERAGYSARWLVFDKGPKKLSGNRDTEALTADSGQNDARRDAEKLLEVIRAWQETDSTGRDAIWAGAKIARKRGSARQKRPRTISASADAR